MKDLNISLYMVILVIWFVFLNSLEKRISWSKKIKNLSLFSLSSLTAYILIPLTLIEFSQEFVAEKSLVIRFFHFLLYDLFIYIQHRAFHEINLFWRIHRTHHLEKSLDTTSGLRFHPLEILISLLYKGLFIYLIGIDAVVVGLFEFTLVFMALWSHAQINLPKGLDEKLSLFLITPYFHQIHHHEDSLFLNSNYAGVFTFWDRLFNSLSEFPSDEKLLIGIKGRKEKGIFKLLLDPFDN